MAVDIELVLVAVDSSDEALDAGRYATEIASRYEASLHLLYVLDQRLRRGVKSGDISPEAVARRQRSIAEEIQAAVPESVEMSRSSVFGFSPSRLDQTPGSVILDAATELDADFLVVPRVSAGSTPERVLGKAALHVLEYAQQPVLSV